MATNEERLAALERDVAELKQARRIQDDRDVALLARIDGFIDDLRRMERVQMRGFEELMLGQRRTNDSLEVVVDALKDHKSAIESLGARVNSVEDRLDRLEAGQQQIISLLTGNPPIHD